MSDKILRDRTPFPLTKGPGISVAVLLLTTNVQAQPPHNRPQPVIVSVNTQLVAETVVVKDKEGRTIEGLTAKDFSVTEDGVPQTISVFEFQRLGDVPAAVPPTSSRIPPIDTVRPSDVLHTSLPAPGDARYRNRRLLALFFDLTSMPPQDQLRAFKAAEAFIRTQMKSPDLLTLLTFDSRGSVRVLEDFTNDRDSLLERLRKSYLDSDDNESADKGAAFGQDDSEFNIFTTDRKLAALQTAVNMLRSVDGKKALVYFASGLNLNGTYNQAQLSATVNAAIRANVALFPVDARGLVASPPLGDATKVSPGGMGTYSGATATGLVKDLQRSQDTLFALAGDTGGMAMVDNNDLATGIVQAEQAITSYYMIGYYPVNSAMDGKFRRVKIVLRESSAARLDFRQGYFAPKTFGNFAASDKERQLEDAFMLGDPITDLTIELEVDYFQVNRTEYSVPIALKIPGNELAHTRRSGAEHTLIDFIAEVKDRDGKTIQNLRDKVDVKRKDTEAEGLSERPIEYDTAFTLLPGTYMIKFLARDAGTGRIGTYQAPFVIPNLASEEKLLPISSVVLSSQRTNMDKPLYGTAKTKNPARSVNPLVVDGRKLVPSVTRVFRGSRTMYVYLQAYEPKATGPHPLVAFVTFFRGQTTALKTLPLQFVDWLDETDLTALPLEFSLSLSMLPPGEYNFQVTVLDPSVQKVAFWQAPIMLIR